MKDQEILQVKDNEDNLTYYKRIKEIEHKEIDWELELDAIEYDGNLGSIRRERYS